jgi:hypothetical protein
MFKTKRMQVRRAVITLLLTAAVVPFIGVNADAIGPERFICTAAGSIVTTATPDTWTIVGGGSCVSQDNPYLRSFTAAGTSEGLGLCSDPSLPFIVQNLDLIVTGTLTSSNPTNPVVKGILQHWTAPLTTYPFGTPFLVTSNTGDVFGAGVFWNHIFLNCQGSPVATFQWEYTV